MEYKKEVLKSRLIALKLCNILKNHNNLDETLDNKSNLPLIKTKICSKFCKNFIKGEVCKWHKKGKCSFAHSFFDLDDFNKQKIIELGIQSYYHLYNNKKKQKMHDSIFDYLNSIKITEQLYLKEYFYLKETKKQYLDLYKYFIELQKELFVLKNINETYINNKITSSNFNEESTIIKNISKLKIFIDDTIGCKICYRSIITTDNLNNIEDKTNFLNNSDKFVILKCGHSICNQCHFNIVSNENTISINCPICREKNEIKNTKPNYILNELIFKIKIIFGEYIKMVDDIDNCIKNNRKSKYITKNISSFTRKNTHITLLNKSAECPW